MTETARDEWSDLARRWVESQDESAARDLMDALHPRVARIVARHVPRGADAADLEQECFLKFFRALPYHRPGQPLDHWISRIALNICRDRGRSAARRPEVRWSDLTEGERVVFDSVRAPECVAPGEGIDAVAARNLLERLMETLPPVDRQILILLHMEDRPVEAIARLLGMSRVLVRVRAHRARLRLRRALSRLRPDVRPMFPVA